MNTPVITEDTHLHEAADECRARILHALEIFPYLSSSMIHIAIGTSTSTKLWRPILGKLVEEGVVCETQRACKGPNDRNQNYTIYHLPANPYSYGPK